MVACTVVEAPIYRKHRRQPFNRLTTSWQGCELAPAYIAVSLPSSFARLLYARGSLRLSTKADRSAQHHQRVSYSFLIGLGQEYRSGVFPVSLPGFASLPTD